MLKIRPIFPFLLTSSLIAVAAPIFTLPASAQERRPEHTQERAQERPASFADLVEKLSPAVVNISTTQKVKTVQGFVGVPFGMPNDPDFEPFRDFFDRFGGVQNMQPQEREVYSLGSGFIIDASGYIITNNHVIEEADEVSVILPANDETNGSKYKAKIVGRDPKTDLALLKVDAKKDLPFVTLGDSDAMRVGDWVIAIGNPFGLGGSVTQGIISARGRNINAGALDDFLQTDAPINRGNSGGPLFNTNGEVIGINSAIFSPSGGSVGIGFSIPSSLAKPVIAQLKEFGRIHRGWLGVKIQDVTEEVADSLGLKKAVGALVLEVGKGSPAEKAGIVAGDVITQFDGKEVNEMRSLPRLVASSKIGKGVSITYLHKNAEKTTQATIGELDEKDEQTASGKKQAGDGDDKQATGKVFVGLEVSNLTPELRARLRLDASQSGLVIMKVAAGSDDAKKGIQEGDLLVEVNNEPVKSASDLKNALAAAAKAGRKFALLKILRAGDEAFVTIAISEDKK
jgi:serine protease Do